MTRPPTGYVMRHPINISNKNNNTIHLIIATHQRSFEVDLQLYRKKKNSIKAQTLKFVLEIYSFSFSRVMKINK